MHFVSYLKPLQLNMATKSTITNDMVHSLKKNYKKMKLVKHLMKFVWKEMQLITMENGYQLKRLQKLLQVFTLH